jgi:hypothetical protein
MYLPKAVALADGIANLGRWDIPDVAILREPLSAGLASTQMRIALELLYTVVLKLAED